MPYFSNDTCALPSYESDASFLHNKTPIKDDQINIVPNQTIFINGPVDNVKYTVMKGFYYLWKGSPIVIIKHLIIDPIQDVLIKLGLDNSIKYISSKFASVFGYEPIEPNLEPGIAHQFMHKIFAPVLKSLGLDAGCNHNHEKNAILLDSNEDSLSSGNDDFVPYRTPARIIKDSKPIISIKLPNSNEDSLSSTNDDFLFARSPSRPKGQQFIPGAIKSVQLCEVEGCSKLHNPNEQPPQGFHVHQPKTFMSDFKEEYVMHASVKAVAVGVFPFIYSIKNANICNGYESFCSYGANTIKAVGINPLELIYGLHSIAAQITPKAYSDIVGNAEFYLSYQHLKGDKELYEYLQAQDLFLEGVDGFIHAIDSIELLYTNRNIPGIKMVAAGMAIAGGILYYNTQIHENEFASEAP